MDRGIENTGGQMGSNEMGDLTKECRVALDTARAAGQYLRNARDDVRIQTFKEGICNFATVQDVEAERIIIEMIRASFPDDAVLAEESSPDVGAAERLWIIDPLDGTRNYANHLSYFSVSVAFYCRNVPQVGVVYAPCLNDELFHAVRGQGAYLNARPLRMVRPDVDLPGSIVATGHSYRRGAALKKEMAQYERFLNKATDVTRYGSAALDLCHVAAGRLGAYYEAGLKPWDVAAGVLIVEEAGGICIDHAGCPLDVFHQDDDGFSVDTLAAKNQTISAAMLAILRS